VLCQRYSRWYIYRTLFFSKLNNRVQLLNFALQHEIKWYASVLVYADYVNILGGSAHNLKKNAEASVVASKETGLEVDAGKTKYMVMSRD
jgi:hypothetical protein